MTSVTLQLDISQYIYNIVITTDVIIINKTDNNNTICNAKN